ncbi:MAG: rod-binding protein [Spirochaetes bacterium]|nr:rod-binding protein [Spirochaetota bacterium]
MSNALTGINNYNFSSELNSLSSIKSKTELYNKETGETKSFKEIFNEKLDKNGKVVTSKLDADEKKLFSACEEMESLLWKQVLNSMKKTINKHKLLDGGQAEEIFSDFLYDEYASMMSKNAGTGISTELYKQLSGAR